MTDIRDIIAAQVRCLRASAKFIAVEHSTSFIDAAAELGDGFFVAYLYDEDVDANLYSFGDKLVIVENSYLSSFAYNMFLCWLLCHGGAAGLAPLGTLLTHNLKKFFTEQAYRAANRIPARALLLETLLYEQAMMVPAFAAKDANAGLSADTDAAQRVMSLALTIHELGHFLMRKKPELWGDLLAAEPHTVGALYADVVRGSTAAFALEFQCDAYAVTSCLRQHEEYAGALFALRAIVFAFAAYAAMYAARATAAATAALWMAGPDENLDFTDIAPMPHVDHDVKWALDAQFLQRARLVTDLCGRLAAKRGLTLFGTDAPFPLPPTIVDDLMAYVGRVFDCADDNARRMSNLVAHALHGHDDGMEYLYLRSKTFRTNRPDPLKV